MRRLLVLAVILGAGLLPARADHEPVIVIPSVPGVPIMINGRDASYAVVEGDWGLARSVHVQPVVTYGWDAWVKPPAAHYFPRSGQQPGFGRLEIEPPPNRRPPRPAQSFQRNWGAESAPNVVTEYPPFDPPPVILAPRERGRGPYRPHFHR